MRYWIRIQDTIYLEKTNTLKINQSKKKIVDFDNIEEVKDEIGN